MTEQEVAEAYERMRKEGWTDEDMLKALYIMFQDGHLSLDELRGMIKVMGYEFTDDFEQMSMKDKKRNGLVERATCRTPVNEERYSTRDSYREMDDERRYKILFIIAKWEPLYHHRTMLPVLLDKSFGDEMKAAGFEMDCGHGLHDKYGVGFDGVLSIIDRINDIDDIGAAIFSHWRYFQHWADSADEIYDYLDWFIAMFAKLKQLVE